MTDPLLHYALETVREKEVRERNRGSERETEGKREKQKERERETEGVREKQRERDKQRE